MLRPAPRPLRSARLLPGILLSLFLPGKVLSSQRCKALLVFPHQPLQLPTRPELFLLEPPSFPQSGPRACLDGSKKTTWTGGPHQETDVPHGPGGLEVRDVDGIGSRPGGGSPPGWRTAACPPQAAAPRLSTEGETPLLFLFLQGRLIPPEHPPHITSPQPPSKGPTPHTTTLGHQGFSRDPGGRGREGTNTEPTAVSTRRSVLIPGSHS